MKFRRGKDETTVGRRLFQDFEQRVVRLVGEHVRFVDHIDLVAPQGGCETRVFPQLPDVLDARVGGGVDFQHVGCRG